MEEQRTEMGRLRKVPTLEKDVATVSRLGSSNKSTYYENCSFPEL